MIRGILICLFLLCVVVNVEAKNSTAVEPLVEPLRTKVKEIVAECGSTVVSTIRSWGKTPNHRQGKAADIKGNPTCIYAHLKGWPGGYSTDYSRVKHVHISYNRAHEWGIRFAHGGRRSTTTLSAKRHHRYHRYAYHYSFRQFPAH